MDKVTQTPVTSLTDYDVLLNQVVRLIDESRRTSSRVVNTVMTATYWLIGRHIVEYEQGGETRAVYGAALLKRMAEDLTARRGRGYSSTNLKQFRKFYLAHPDPKISQTPSAQLLIGRTEKGQTLSDPLAIGVISTRFPLPWSAYVSLLSVKNDQARHFYETEALRGGWGARQLDRQIDALFYERTAAAVQALCDCSRTSAPQGSQPRQAFQESAQGLSSRLGSRKILRLTR
jgi:hypothetical protein